MSDKNLVPSEKKDVKLGMRQNYLSPAVDIYELDGGLTLIADMPGATSEKLQIDIEQGVLTLEAKTDIGHDGERVFSEFAPSGYYRQFRLPEHLDLEQVDARLRHGVLTLRLPKAEAALPKKIEVKTIH
jgi:HSP20 family molecular chaperone IbpA